MILRNNKILVLCQTQGEEARTCLLSHLPYTIRFEPQKFFNERGDNNEL